MTRLPYETVGGHVSESITLSQLTEYLRLAEECCYTLNHLRRANDDPIIANGFLAFGKGLAKFRENLVQLATTSGGLVQ